MSDFDGDGYIDAVDADGDGYLDTFDTNSDGIADTFDVNEDGFVDATDYNADGFVDAPAIDIAPAFDVGGDDGGFDVTDPSGVGTSAGYDLDGDGLVDSYDVDGDGFLDTAGSDAPFSGATDVNGDGLVDGNPNTFLAPDDNYSQAEQAAGYSASDSSFIEPPDAAGSSSLISDNQDPGL